jgi:membrane protease YdiL (CAAX protease family)
MKTFLEVSMITLTCILPFVFSSLAFDRNRESKKHFTNAENLFMMCVGSLAPALVILYVVYSQTEGFDAIGLSAHPQLPNQVAIFVGLVAVVFGAYILAVAYRLFQKNKPEQEEPSPILKLFEQYRTPLERIVYLIGLSFLVIEEDLLCRGYLVLYWGAKTHTYLPWVLLSLSVSVVMHLYQGKNLKFILSHLLFAGIMIGMTLLTRNLLTAIGGHLYYDIVFTITQWNRLDKQRSAGTPAANP